MTSRAIAHQFVRLRQLPDLQLAGLLAVGDIQDDARRDFIQSALDSGADYLIIDAHDIARLLIAYERICPQDGTPYDDGGRCDQDHERDPGVAITYRVSEDPRYEITKLQDVSHAGAKRYSAVILVDKHYPRPVLREIVRAATEEVRQSTYSRSELVEVRWREAPAHVVWLFLAFYPEDVRRANWICRTEWIDPGLRSTFRPVGMRGDERVGSIEIAWNDRYDELKKLYEGFSASKGEVLRKLRPIVKQMLQWGDMIALLFERYRIGSVPEHMLVSELKRLEPSVSTLYHQSGHLPIPPDDVKDYDQVCHNIFAHVDNMVLPFSDLGRHRWERNQRDSILEMSVRHYQREKERLRFEEDKLN